MEVTLAKGGNGEDGNRDSGPVDTKETQEDRAIPEEDMQRANLYGLLARLLQPKTDIAPWFKGRTTPKKLLGVIFLAFCDI